MRLSILSRLVSFIGSVVAVLTTTAWAEVADSAQNLTFDVTPYLCSPAVDGEIELRKRKPTPPPTFQSLSEMSPTSSAWNSGTNIEA
jgi:hypothetical protein